MGKINLANFKKTYYYLKKNGVKAAFTAVCERLRKSPLDAYAYERPSDEELMRQRREVFNEPVTISLLVPAFNTKRTYLDALLLSVWEQTYPYWELVLADAGSDLEVREALEGRVCRTAGKRQDPLYPAGHQRRHCRQFQPGT